MSQPFFKRLGAKLCRRDSVGQYFMQARRAVTETTKDEVVDAQKLKGDIPPDILPTESHRFRKFDHVGVDPQGYIPAGRVAMRKVAVFVSQYRAKSRLFEI